MKYFFYIYIVQAYTVTLNQFNISYIYKKTLADTKHLNGSVYLYLNVLTVLLAKRFIIYVCMYSMYLLIYISLHIVLSNILAYYTERTVSRDDLWDDFQV